MAKREIKHKDVMPLEQLTRYFQELTEGMQKRLISIQKGGETLILIPAEEVKVELEAEEKKDKSKFTITISWRRDEKSAGEKDELKISGDLTSQKDAGSDV